jgi:hypothetical protein
VRKEDTFVFHVGIMKGRMKRSGREVTRRGDQERRPGREKQGGRKEKGGRKP